MTAAVTTVMTTRDETAEATGNRYRYSRIVDTAGHVVRVRIERDFYDSYSFAQVEVINGVKCWTHLLDEPVRDWWDTTPSPRKDINVAAVLAPVAERLLRRAATILGPPTTAVSPRVLDAVAALLGTVYGFDGERRVEPTEITWATTHGGGLHVFEHADGAVTFTKAHRDDCPFVTSTGTRDCDDECYYEHPTRLDGLLGS